MLYLLLGGLVFWLAMAGAKAFAKANPAELARLLKRAGGFLSLAIALALLLLGRIGAALTVGAFGFWLLGISSSPLAWLRTSPVSWFRSVGSGRTANQTSRVRSAMIEMEFDHGTGAMRGQILAGPDQGKWLDDLTRPQCMDFYRLCLRDDPEGGRLLEAYLDRRFPGWREADERDGNFGRRGGGGDGSMTEDQAYKVLGLQQGATRDAIVQAHHALMKKLHPDHGGSTDLAARVNEAKDVLLRHL